MAIDRAAGEMSDVERMIWQGKQNLIGAPPPAPKKKAKKKKVKKKTGEFGDVSTDNRTRGPAPSLGGENYRTRRPGLLAGGAKRSTILG